MISINIYCLFTGLRCCRNTSGSEVFNSYQTFFKMSAYSPFLYGHHIQDPFSDSSLHALLSFQPLFTYDLSPQFSRLPMLMSTPCFTLHCSTCSIRLTQRRTAKPLNICDRDCRHESTATYPGTCLFDFTSLKRCLGLNHLCVCNMCHPDRGLLIAVKSLLLLSGKSNYWTFD
jgi:hypothetical protein